MKITLVRRGIYGLDDEYTWVRMSKTKIRKLIDGRMDKF